MDYHPDPPDLLLLRRRLGQQRLRLRLWLQLRLRLQRRLRLQQRLRLRLQLRRSAEDRAAKGLRCERSETARGDRVPGGRFAQSNSLELLRPDRFAA